MESDRRSTTALVEAVSPGSAVDLVMQMARDTFGSDEKAQRWLHRPTQALSGATPFEVSSSGESGRQTVVDLLKRIDHGLSV